MNFTYNKWPYTENFHTEFYQDRAKQIAITKKYINYDQERTSTSCGAISMLITYNE
jgi:hypothetical protein